MSTRENGEGLIRKRKDGRYELRIMDGYQKNGKQKVVSFYGNHLAENAVMVFCGYVRMSLYL